VGEYFKDGLFHAFRLNAAGFTTLLVPGAINSNAHGINAIGKIVGAYDYDLTFNQHGFIFFNGVYDFFDVHGAVATYPRGINDTGLIVGDFKDNNSKRHGFILENDNYMIIDVPGATQTRIHGINDTGQFVGDYNLNGTHGFIYSNGRYITLDFPNAIATRATGINNSGQIVGAYTSPTGKIYGFLASPKNTTGAIALLLLSD
jgi:uncharacterized membrane protein